MKDTKGICCKSYTLQGSDGGEITFSETIDRRSIRITARGPLTGQLGAAILEITAEQFKAMCNFDSYNGLEVTPRFDLNTTAPEELEELQGGQGGPYEPANEGVK